MILKFLPMISVVTIVGVWGQYEDLRDFSYTVELSIKQDNSLFDEMADLVTESEIESEAKKLPVFAQQDKPVSSMTALNDRINKDIKALEKILHTFGYYNAKVKYDVGSVNNNSVKIYIKIDTNKKFNLNLSIKCIDKDENFNEQYVAILKDKFKALKASMSEFRMVINESLDFFRNKGFFNPKATKKKVFIDYENEVAFLNLEIICGNKANFGETEIVAFPGIDEQFVRNRLLWNKGEIFSIDKVNSSISDLKDTQIFSSVKIKPVESKLQGKNLPMQVEVKEDKKNLLNISLMYKGVRNMNFEKKSQATKGVKSIIAKASWTRLNAFGKGEKLTFNAEGTPMRTSEKRVDYAFEAILNQPDVFAKNAVMEYGAAHRQELTNVFFKKNEKFNFEYSFPLTDVWSLNAGFSFEDNYIDSDPIFFAHEDQPHYYKIQAIPISFVWDRTDSLLNPTSGFKFIGKGTWMRLSGAGINSLKFYNVAFSYNYSLDKLKKNILAFHIHKKGILSSDIDRIPVDKRLYAGGINSVRGYANQMATELIEGAQVTMGGKSLMEFSTEYRRKINQNWGVITFFDGAKIFGNQSKYFKTEKKRWFFSVGAGMRYYTSVGPIRIDFAFPIRRRKGVDSKMQFIMGLGQSF